MHRCNLTLTEHISETQLCSAPQVKRNPTSNCCINSRHCSSACPSCCLLVFYTQTLTVLTFWGTCSFSGNLQNPSLGSRSSPAFPHAQQWMRADAETCRTPAQHLLTCPDLFLQWKPCDPTQREGLNPYRAQKRKSRTPTRACSVTILEFGKSLGLPGDSEQQHSSKYSHWDAGRVKDISLLTDTINSAWGKNENFGMWKVSCSAETS